MDLAKKIRNRKRAILLSAFPFFLVSCSTPFKRHQCAIPAEEIGQCFAQTGYNTNFYYNNFAKYCTNEGVPQNITQFEKARTQRLKELCNDTPRAFAMTFRGLTALSTTHPCTKEVSNLKNIDQINKDAKEAASYYNTMMSARISQGTAESRREKADDEGFWDGLFDRALQPSSESYKQDEDEAKVGFNNILLKYSKFGITEQTLTVESTRPRCFGDTSLF